MLDKNDPKQQAEQGRTDGERKPRRDQKSRRWGNPRRRRSRLYAAVDLGTNNCRLLIVERSGEENFRVRDSFTRIVRLGEGLEGSGRLSDEAMDRTIAALRICASKIRKADVARMRCVATEACRGAENGEEFIKRVKKETGLTLEIIDGQAEAELAAIGCGSLFDRNVDDIVLFDIGGGSTEISRMSRQEHGFFRQIESDSVPLGVVRLSERYAGAGPHEHGYDGMLAESEDRLRDFMERQSDLSDMSKLQIIGTSGTVTTLAAVQLGLARYDRNVVDGCTISAGDISDVIGKLRQMSRDELAENPCIGKQRADLVLSGCAVLDAIHGKWPVEKVWVADRGLREGLLLRMIRQDTKHRGTKRRDAKRPRGGQKSRHDGNTSRDEQTHTGDTHSGDNREQ